MTPGSTLGGLLIRAAGLIRANPATFAALTIWAFAPLAATVAYVAINGGILTGTNGADLFDQFQYLAWIRDEGSHLLASNLWVIGGTPHDYVEPMYLISGLLWRLGLSVQVAYLIWKPVALLVLFLGFAAYARRMLRGRWAASAAVLREPGFRTGQSGVDDQRPEAGEHAEPQGDHSPGRVGIARSGAAGCPPMGRSRSVSTRCTPSGYRAPITASDLPRRCGSQGR
ncbi:MAG TPA: hypothetical protein VLP43_07145 [Solirubrobacteraceae bacterium]|nr:hypothetical protein [Solirubrobacteraceae bacterium]